VYEEDEAILGFSIAIDASPSIWALFVLPQQERRGIGNVLHEAAAQWLWSRGAGVIWLSTEPGTHAEKFYRDRGWQKTEVLENGDIGMELRRAKLT
jgi:GNAT superfamily N-acetyltransferase